MGSGKLGAVGATRQPRIPAPLPPTWKTSGQEVPLLPGRLPYPGVSRGLTC